MYDQFRIWRLSHFGPVELWRSHVEGELFAAFLFFDYQVKSDVLTKQAAGSRSLINICQIIYFK